MKSMGHAKFGLSATTKALGLPRFNRWRGSICYPAMVCPQAMGGRTFNSGAQ